MLTARFASWSSRYSEFLERSRLRLDIIARKLPALRTFSHFFSPSKCLLSYKMQVEVEWEESLFVFLPAPRSSLNYMHKHEASSSSPKLLRDFNELNGLCEGLPRASSRCPRNDPREWNQNMCPHILHSPNAISRMKVKLRLLLLSSSSVFYGLPRQLKRPDIPSWWLWSAMKSREERQNNEWWRVGARRMLVACCLNFW